MDVCLHKLYHMLHGFGGLGLLSQQSSTRYVDLAFLYSVLLLEIFPITRPGGMRETMKSAAHRRLAWACGMPEVSVANQDRQRTQFID